MSGWINQQAEASPASRRSGCWSSPGTSVRAGEALGTTSSAGPFGQTIDLPALPGWAAIFTHAVEPSTVIDPDTSKRVGSEWRSMSRWTDDPLIPIGIVVGAFLIVAGISTLVTAPWQHQGQTLVTLLRILGTIGTILIGLGLIYVVWGAQWLSTRRA